MKARRELTNRRKTESQCASEKTWLLQDICHIVSTMSLTRYSFFPNESNITLHISTTLRTTFLYIYTHCITLKALTGEANNIDDLVDIRQGSGRHRYQAACEQSVLQVDVL